MISLCALLLLQAVASSSPLPPEHASPAPTLKGAGELTIDDARKVLEAQRTKLYLWNETNRLARESLQKQREAEEADKQLDSLLESLRDKYACYKCDLMFDMKWQPPVRIVRSESEKPKETEKK